MAETPSDDTLAHAFTIQAHFCDAQHAPFTAALMRRVAENLNGEALAGLFGEQRDADAALRDALPLRLAGAIHYGVLAGFASAALRALYQQAGDTAALWPEVEKFLREHRPFVASYLRVPPQTNEVMRSAALLGGFLEAARLGLPLALCELGASAGLNLHWDKFHYHADNFLWGDEHALVKLELDWQGAPPLVSAPIHVARRAGCDSAPLDPGGREEDRWRLQSYIWPEQKHRLARQRAAIEQARMENHRVAKADALAFCEYALNSRRADELLVIYHSVFWQYMAREKQRALTALIERAGRDSGLPLAWLSMEPRQGTDKMEVRLRLWRGDGGEKEERVLARAGAHGRPVIWL